MKASPSPRLSRLAAALALAVFALPALAQDPPTRAGRIAYTAGAVSFSPAGTDEWAQAPLNRPLVAGDRLWTEPGARDEAQFGPAIARMDGGTLMQVVAADEGMTQLQIAQGRIDLHVRRVGSGEAIEVDTPNLAFVVRAPGDYRIAVAPDGGSTDVAALRGEGDVYGDGDAFRLGPGQGYRFAGQDLENLGALPIQSYDEFDRWAQARDERLDHARSARFVPADLVGYEDLDDNGAWRVVPDYGTVWVPTRVAADWAPYHSGHWAWIDPWGWTWVDDQPWGYAVSHYGRWANIDNRWAWVPSPPRERAVYAPALVAFVGAVLALGAADAAGPGVGWFPLGPREAYRPPYHASPAYITRVNVSNSPFRPGVLEHELRDPAAQRYANRAVPGALMAMPAAQFAQAAPVARAARVLPPRLALSAPVMATPAARPLPQSRIGTPPAHALPPAGAQGRIAVAHGLPHGLAHGAPPAAHMAPQALAQRGMAPAAPVPHAAPLRMLRPAPAVRPGVPPPHAAAPQFAGRPATPPAAVPNPVHGQRWAGARPEAAGARPAPMNPTVAAAHGHGPAALPVQPMAPSGHVPPPGSPLALGRSSMQETRAGGPEPRTATAASAAHGAPARAEAPHAQAGPPHPMPAPRMEAAHASAPAPHAAAPAHVAAPAPHLPPHPQALEAARSPAPHMVQSAHSAHSAAPPARPQPQHQQAAPRPEPPPHAQPAPHPQPPHPPAAAPHPEPAHAPPPGKGGGHDAAKDHEHEHGH